MRCLIRFASTVALALILLGTAACDHKAPTTPVNHPPVITGITMSTQVIGPSDSAVVTIHATDPDGDTLVYDWMGTTAIRIKGAPGIVYIYNSPIDSAVFFYNAPGTGVDTVRIECSTRDRRGGMDGVVIALVRHN